MTLSETIVQQWMPAGRKAAQLIGGQYRVSIQEKRDLLDMLPSVIWSAVADGCLTAGTRVKLAIVIICRRLVGGSPGLKGHKFWRPDSVKTVLPNGRRYIWRRDVWCFSDTDDAEKKAEAIPVTGEEVNDLLEVVRAVAKVAYLSRRQRLALEAKVLGKRQEDVAAEWGVSRNVPYTQYWRAIRKCLAESEKVREVLT